MKPSDKVIEKCAELISGADAFDLYLKEIRENVRVMMGHADVMETLLLKLEKQQAEQAPSEHRESTQIVTRSLRDVDAGDR